MVNQEIGFSLWLDFVERDFLKNDFLKLIKNGVINGATSNPAIFASAITTSPAYKEQLDSLDGKSAKEKYEALAIADIKTAAQALRECYDEGNDGYISIEVDPFLSNDTQATVEEGKRLFNAIGEPNVMIKVPATPAGYEAMSQLMSDGISVNATLIFSPQQARECLDAMKRGLDEYDVIGGCRVEGVISVFVSRFDRLLDPKLKELGLPTAKTGLYNAAKIYNMIETNHTPAIKTLFASTGVKGDELEPSYYIRELLAPHSVNTAPLATIQEYIKGVEASPKLPIADDEIEEYFAKLEANGIDMQEVYDALLSDGLVAFEKAFKDMLDTLK
jgi:transaldolase